MADVHRHTKLILDHLDGVLDDAQVGKAQEVHFQEAKGLNQVMVPLCDDVAVLVALQGQVVGKLGVGDDDARGMGAEIAVDALQLHGRIEQLLDRGAAQLRAIIVHLLQLIDRLESVLEARAERDELGDQVCVFGKHAQRSPHVTDGLLGLHPAEGRHLGN